MAESDTHKREMSAQHLLLTSQQLIILLRTVVGLLEKPRGCFGPVNKPEFDWLKGGEKKRKSPHYPNHRIN